MDHVAKTTAVDAAKQHLIWIHKSNVLAVESVTNSTGLVSTKSVNKIFGSLLNAIEHDNCSGTS